MEIELTRIINQRFAHRAEAAWLDELHADIAGGAVAIEHHAIPLVDLRRWTGHGMRRLDGAWFLFKGRTHKHKELCARGAAWLEHVGHADWQSECDYPPGRADVASPSAQLAVEAGGLSACKPIFALVNGWRVFVIPYPDDKTDLLTKPLDGFLFTRLAPLRRESLPR